MPVCNSNTKRGRNRQIFWSSGLPEWMSSRFNKRPYCEKKGKKKNNKRRWRTIKMTSNISHAPPLVYTVLDHVHMQAQPYKYTHAQNKKKQPDSQLEI